MQVQLEGPPPMMITLHLTDPSDIFRLELKLEVPRLPSCVYCCCRLWYGDDSEREEEGDDATVF